MYKQEEKYIENSKPRRDCIYCQIRNFVDMKGKKLPLQYAQCTNQVVCYGMTAIDIVPKPQPFEYTTGCNNCKHYESKQQLTLF